METTLFENVSLKSIIKHINLLGTVIPLNAFKIISKNNPDVFIKIIEIDITDYPLNEKDLEDIKYIEPSFSNFVVFQKIEEVDEETKDIIKVLIVTSLFELITLDTLDNKKIWDLNLPNWTLIQEELKEETELDLSILSTSLN